MRRETLDWISDQSVLPNKFGMDYLPTLPSKRVECGVPQGSILGPLLFVVVDFILFADDTNIFFSHQDFNLPSETLNSELKKLTQWYQANKLSINFKKI